ncbi:unnamed protein product, partial [Polarella glacialis]
LSDAAQHYSYVVNCYSDGVVCGSPGVFYTSAALQAHCEVIADLEMVRQAAFDTKRYCGKAQKVEGRVLAYWADWVHGQDRKVEQRKQKTLRTHAFWHGKGWVEDASGAWYKSPSGQLPQSCVVFGVAQLASAAVL